MMSIMLLSIFLTSMFATMIYIYITIYNEVYQYQNNYSGILVLDVFLKKY